MDVSSYIQHGIKMLYEIIQPTPPPPEPEWEASEVLLITFIGLTILGIGTYRLSNYLPPDPKTSNSHRTNLLSPVRRANIKGNFLIFSPTEHPSDVEIAARILKHFKDFRVTDLDRSWMWDGKEHEKKGIIKKLEPIAALAARDYQATLAKHNVKKIQYGEDKSLIIEFGNNAAKTMAGACDNCAAAVIANISDTQKWKSRLELVNGGNHAYVICARSENTLLANPETWNKEAFISDLWIENVPNGYPGLITESNKIKKHIENFGLNLYVICAWEAGELLK